MKGNSTNSKVYFTKMLVILQKPAGILQKLEVYSQTDEILS